MEIDPAALEPRDLYRLMISAVVPRPIAWVSTCDASGGLNAAPFSYFQALSSHPPSIMISVGRKRDGVEKDTRANILATGEFVVNIVGEDSGARMVRTSVAYDAGVSEFAEVGLEPAPSVCVRPPRIAECAVAFECKLDRVLEIGASGICIGTIVRFHARDDVLAADGTIDPARLRPLGRLGGSTYAPVREIWSITPEGEVTTVGSELLELWRDARDRSIAIARELTPDHLARRARPDGMTVGRMLRHLAACTASVRSLLAGGEEVEAREWDPSWTPDRLAAELESDRDAFVEAMRRFLPRERAKLGRMIRHESWHQGQIAAALGDAMDELTLWRA